jgi:hypothetical protein
MNYRPKLIAMGVVLAAFSALACQEKPGPITTPGAPASAEDKRAQGKAILAKMSDKLKSAQAATFTTTETSDRVRRNNERKKLNLTRQVAVRRPDRLWFKVTGDRDLEAFYDGKKVTLVSHKEKVFGEFRAAPTLDETADMITSRYNIPLPVADLLTYDPQTSLFGDDTTGGLDRQETLDGVLCNVLAYQHPRVDFSIWIPASGDPLPKKLDITYKARRGQPTTVVMFKDWNLSPPVNDATFTPVVPNGYEGIPVIQRAASVIADRQAEEKAGAAKGATPELKKK